MLSLHQLTCFISVYEHGSLTRAAEELGFAKAGKANVKLEVEK